MRYSATCDETASEAPYRLATRSFAVYASENRFYREPGALNNKSKISHSIERRPNEKIKLFRPLGKAAGYTLESADSLLQDPGYDPRIVVTETEVMIQG